MKVQKTEEQWRKDLTPEQYSVLREKGTEAPFSGKYVNTADNGMYSCAACGQEIFSSDTKYESTAPGLQGWPAFSQVVGEGKVQLRPDYSGGMERTQVICGNCGSHLGHLFDDPTPQEKDRKHYCINSCALSFDPKDKK